MNKHELTEEQKQAILDKWNSEPNSPPSLLDIIKTVFPNQDLDGRTKEGKAVREFLATKSIKARASHEYQAKERNDLSEEDKVYIQNNLELMSSVEIARTIFKNPQLTNLNQESRVVSEFIKSLNKEEAFENPEEVPSETYKPPKTFEKTLYRINKYTNDSIDKENITGIIKRNVNTLIDYLNTYRFVYQINTYINTTNRELFESSFIRYTCDKPDLSQEEVDQYIVLASEVVISASIQKRKEHLTTLLDNVVQDTDGRASMSLVEAIGKTETD